MQILTNNRLADDVKRSNHLLNVLILALSLSSEIVLANPASKSADVFKYPFYLGAVGGWGATTWQGLVPTDENQNSALSISTPIEVKEGGGVWGFSAGYELTPFFAFEANYMHFPDALLTFDQDSFFAFEQDGLTELRTHTQTASLIAKIMLVLPKTSMRLFSGAGVASVWRNDTLNATYRISPTFAVGVNMNFNEHLMGELGTTYTAGYGEPEINPTKDFVPFLYSFFVKAALRF